MRRPRRRRSERTRCASTTKSACWSTPSRQASLSTIWRARSRVRARPIRSHVRRERAYCSCRSVSCWSGAALCQPWHFDVESYNEALQSEGVSARENELALLSTLPGVFAPLIAAMREKGRWAYQEGIAHLLAQDI